MSNRRTTLTKCQFCGKEFERATTNLQKSLANNRGIYCTQICAGKALLSTRMPVGKIQPFGEKNVYSANRIDKYTGLRGFIRRAKGRNCPYNLTIEYLYNLWEKQEGKCPYTGVNLIKPSMEHPNDKIYTASLDKIIPELGYVEGNVQFISMALNYMKNVMSHEDTIKLCKLISQHWRNK